MKNNKVGRFKKYKNRNPCRMCIYRKKSLAKELQGSFIAQSGEAYFFVMKGLQYYCKKECQNV